MSGPAGQDAHQGVQQAAPETEPPDTTVNTGDAAPERDDVPVPVPVVHHARHGVSSSHRLGGSGASTATVSGDPFLQCTVMTMRPVSLGLAASKASIAWRKSW
jgi:hypothetical protein